MKRKKTGFTLIEMVIVLAITVIILGITSSMFITSNKIFSDSDVKSTLQMEGQAIQEKISNICMQAKGIKIVQGSMTTNEVSNLEINSYDENGNLQEYDFTISDSGKNYKNDDNKGHIYEFKIDDQVISNNVKSFKIDSNSMKTDENGIPLGNVNSTEFTILLRKEQGYSNVEQTINFRVAFRNK